MSGLSGAVIFTTDDFAHKSGGNEERTAAQGAWLRAHEAEGLPKVFSVHARGYKMERLYTPMFAEPDVSEVVRTLRRDVWSKPPEVAYDPNALLNKLTSICTSHAPGMAGFALRAFNMINHGPQTPCLTHGDPTAENVMWRKDGTVVITDPVPATPAVPDLQEVDIAKMMQSALGWEKLRESDVVAWQPHELADELGEDRLEAARPWCAVHLFRTLPYAPKEVQGAAIGLIPGLLGV